MRLTCALRGVAIVRCGGGEVKVVGGGGKLELGVRLEWAGIRWVMTSVITHELVHGDIVEICRVSSFASSKRVGGTSHSSTEISGNVSLSKPRGIAVESGRS